MIAGSADVRRIAGVQLVRLPALVRGRPVMPAWPTVGDVREAVASAGRTVHRSTVDGSYLLGRRAVDRATLRDSGEFQISIIAAPHPADLIEPDPGAAIGELLRLPYDEVVSFVDAVGAALAVGSPHSTLAGDLLAATWPIGDRAHRAFLHQLPRLFDGAAVREMMERDLGGAPWAVLDGWGATGSAPVRGPTARLAERTSDLAAGPVTAPAQVRAVPTRQLHLTAGNAPVVPVASLLWAWATKGACVVKPAAGLAAVVAALAGALAEVDPAHPLSRHTTLAYWPGGDPAVEDVLLAGGAFDRRLVWGSADTVDSVLRRGGDTETLVMRPRHALSLIGRSALGAALPDTARRAAADSLVADQQACMSSLLHVVEADADGADAYARELAMVLARWDGALPHRAPPDSHARLVGLRRGLLGTARWHLNGDWPDVTSAVARIDGGFDLSRHPGGRLVLVQAVDDLREALALIGPEVANVGVAPEPARIALRDDLVARGVDNVSPLGEAEIGYPGRPHDGMRVLSRLVRWVNG